MTVPGEAMTATEAGARPLYLADARQAGLLRHLDGHPFVAGEHYDVAAGERQCLVEYCDPALLGVGVERLLTAFRAVLPESDVIVLRTPGGITLPAPWLAHLTYVRFAGPLAVTSPAAAVSVSAAEPEHDALIEKWLIQAFVSYRDEQQHRGDPAAVRAAVRQVLSAADRSSYVARIGDRVIGHATLLCDAYDDVAMGRHVEVLDMLVDTEPPARGAALAALTSASVAHAARLGLPLIGQVVHPTVAEIRAKGDAIVRSLLDRGWVIDHRYWRWS